MASEMVFTIGGSGAEQAERITLAEAGFTERADLQEWILQNPEMLGSDVKIVSFEFDRWVSSTGKERDRLDILAIDAEGRLVVAELKRDRAPDTVEMQAIKYAAMASRFTEDALVEQYMRFRNRNAIEIDADQARLELEDHTGGLDPEALRRPRIVLVAGSFPPVVTASVVWLTEMGLDIALQQVQAYRVFDGRTIVSVSQLYPVPDIEDFTVSPERSQQREATERRRRTREKSTVQKLVRSRILADGTPLLLRPTAEVPDEARDAIVRWVAVDPLRGKGTWFNNRSAPIEWAADGARRRPTAIVQDILEEVGIAGRSVRGPAWWTLEDGTDLPTVAARTSWSTFDWTDLHDILDSMRPGTWTTYGDLAQVIGTAAQPVGQHIASCDRCTDVFRVLGSDGRPRPNFSWNDPTDTRTQREALEADGVRFIGDAADEAQRLDLRVLG